MTEHQALSAIEQMKLEILRKGPHALFINAANTLIFYPAGSAAAAEAEKMSAFDLAGVYTKTSKLADILLDTGA